MNLFQHAVETYDAHIDYVGKEIEGHQMLAPASHFMTRPDLEIALDQTGGFVSARLVNQDEPLIPIPVTESSAGRTSNVCSHPLCDQLCYLAPNSEKNDFYVNQLSSWNDSAYSHPMLLPILTYVKNGTIVQDLLQSGVIKLNKHGELRNDKLLVCWRVLGMGTPKDGCWQQPSLFQSFQDWYLSTRATDKKALCMITGAYEIPAKQHPKGVCPTKPGAKLISTNDKGELVFRGRFTDAAQAITVGYVASQKAHSALRWLVAEQGVKAMFGNRFFLCWNPQGVQVSHVVGPFGHASEDIVTPSDYRMALKKTLAGYASLLPNENAQVVIAALEAICDGRISVTYYHELKASDFLQRLYNWDLHCCWHRWYRGIYAPSLWQIVNCAFGAIEKGKLETSPGLAKTNMQRLIACRLGEAHMPRDIMYALVNRAVSPQSYDREIWQNILVTACAVIKKYRYDHYKEECDMELHADTDDRSYQFGRLLAVMEKAERDTFKKDETREPRAIRMMSMFYRRPLYTAAVIEKNLDQAYFPRLKPVRRNYYRKLMADIMDCIHSAPEADWNRPLGETFLMGYYLQRKDLYTFKPDCGDDDKNLDNGENQEEAIEK